MDPFAEGSLLDADNPATGSLFHADSHMEPGPQPTGQLLPLQGAIGIVFKTERLAGTIDVGKELRRDTARDIIGEGLVAGHGACDCAHCVFQFADAIGSVVIGICRDFPTLWSIRRYRLGGDAQLPPTLPPLLLSCYSSPDDQCTELPANALHANRAHGNSLPQIGYELPRERANSTG